MTDIAQRIEAEVRRHASEAGHLLDAEQESVLGEAAGLMGKRLDADPEALAASVDPVGIFVHGPAGRGKTWLLDALFRAAPLPDEAKQRVHFHTFFQQLQRHFAGGAGARAAIEATVAELLDGTRLFFFDELHIHDPAGGSLLNLLLARLAASPVCVLISSNYPPSGLLPNPVYHHVCEPGIAVLEKRFSIRALDGGADYRRRGGVHRGGFAAGRWLVGGDMEGLQSAGLRAPEPGERTEVSHGRHRFTALAVRGRQVWFDFADLLEEPTTPEDYLHWLMRFDDWVLSGVPRLSGASRDAQQRLVGLIDVLADADVPLTVVAEVPLDDFADLRETPPDLFRAESRLALLAAD